MDTRATSEEENVHPTLRDLNISASDRPTGESEQVLSCMYVYNNAR